MSTESHPVLTLSVVAGGAITGYRCVGYNDQQAGAAAAVKGIARHDAATGEQLAIDVSGVVPVEAGAAIAAGAAVEANAAGKVITLASGVVVGRAVQAAAADTDLIRIKLA